MYTKPLSKVAVVTAALGALLAMGGARADELSVDVTGIDSYAKFGSTKNVVIEEQLAPGAEVTGVSWDANLTAFSPSLLSNMQITFTDSLESVGVILTPGYANTTSGTATLTGSDDLVADGLSFAVGSDGLLRIEFNESKTFKGLSPAGIWNSGTITFDVSALPVPEPASYALMAFGLAGIGLAAKRRKAG
jgi:hypothetical protein